MLCEEWKSRYKNLKNFNTVLQRCPRFWPLAPPRGMNPGVYSLGISEDPPRYLSSKFDASVRSDCWDISIWKTLTQCDGNGNANASQTQTQTWTTGVTTIALLVLRTGELKIMYTPVNPNFTIQKWGSGGSKLYRHVSVMDECSTYYSTLQTVQSR